MIKIVFNLLNKKFIFTMFALITIQQILVAMGTACLSLSGQNLNKPTHFVLFITGFLILSILPHFVTIFLRKTEMQGYFQAYYSFIELRLLKFAGSAKIWPNHQQKEKYQTAIGPEAENYLTAIAFSIFDIFLFLLTIALNILAISLVVDSRFILAFAVSAIVSYWVFSRLSSSIDQLIEREQENKMRFLSYLLKSWDNVFLKNSQINQKYISKLEGHFEQTYELIGKANFQTELLVLILTIASCLPVFVLIIYLTVTHLQDASYLAGLMVTIPKQISILSNYRSVFQQVTNLNTFTTRFRSYWESSHLTESDLSGRIKPEKIRLNGQAFDSVEQLIKDLDTTKKGRILITGNNGAGKSTLLVHLNAFLPESFYLPSSPSLEIGDQLGSESTGERILKHLEFVANNPTPVLLLDEWDANLDNTNKELINERIDQLARQSLVLEVRHRS
ncbi:hypothetical protein [Bdellovibrio svalbardensis]|uniref:ABC transmembrane type-1 domain-containing protein n=1 Tax=Bdellovibrio svalbardensis TaxID=2972972 RepID=A0ABT6DIS9_9BACT|nr:hypothetical protein [Bdellovibrio svalbardensis]MDG0816735.1 hypothetical protein [Bdellovibrio svalbardensis]